LLDSIKNGSNFKKLVEKYSNEPSLTKVGGDVFYLTAGELPEELENPIYSTEPGQVYPEVIHTKYGYNIIKVTDKRLRTPEVRFSHLMTAFKSNPASNPDTINAKLKMDSVLTELKAGVDFAKVAEKYSDDIGTKSKGGDFGYIGIRAINKQFSEPLFNLKNIGDVTPVIQSNFGFHILKLTDKKSYPSFEEDKDNLKKIYQKTSYQQDYDTLLAGLKNKYHYKVNDETLSYLLANIDSGNVGDVNPKYDNVKDSILFSFTGASVKVSEFLEQLSESQDYANKKVSPDLFKDALNKISNNTALEQGALNLDKSDREFAALMTNYKNGIFIFKLQEDEIWDKVKVDSVKLADFYAATKDNYKWPDRVNFSEIFSKSDSAIQYYYNLLTNGANFDSLAAKYTEREDFKSKNGAWGLQDVTSSDVASEANKLEKPGDYSKPVKTSDGYSIVYLVVKEPSSLKTFEEAKAEVSGAYQESESKKIEKEYLDNLTKLYTPIINYNELDKVFKSN
ncbi:MAG: peptidylprolyl isomerase, partial [Ignavibacteriaceae bacterium]